MSRCAIPLVFILVQPFFALPPMAQTNRMESDQGMSCPGASHAITLGQSGFVELEGAATHLTFGPALHVCFDGGEVVVHAPTPKIYSCRQIHGSPDAGIGHYFIAEGMPFHLWFHVDAQDSAPTLEIGLYREDEQLAWIDTGFPLCGG